MRRSGSSRLAVKDPPESFSLRQIRALVDNGLLRAVALGDLAWPIHEHRPVQAVEIRTVEVSLFDVAAHHSLAVSIGCLRTELARAFPGAVAIRELRTTNHPSISHRIPQFSHVPIVSFMGRNRVDPARIRARPIL